MIYRFFELLRIFPNNSQKEIRKRNKVIHWKWDSNLIEGVRVLRNLSILKNIETSFDIYLIFQLFVCPNF